MCNIAIGIAIRNARILMKRAGFSPQYPAWFPVLRGVAKLWAMLDPPFLFTSAEIYLRTRGLGPNLMHLKSCVKALSEWGFCGM